MEPQRLNKQRSPWRQVEMNDRIAAVLNAANCTDMSEWRRDVHDGFLTAFRTIDGGELHLSIAHHSRGQAKRYPTWDEIAHARDTLLPGDVDFVMWLPKAAEYVAFHDTTFHLHEHREPRPS